MVTTKIHTVKVAFHVYEVLPVQTNMEVLGIGIWPR